MSRRSRQLLAALVAAPWCIWAVVRLLALDAGWPVVPALSFTPWVALTSVLPIVFALLMRSWSVAVIATVTALALGSVLIDRVTVDDQPATSGRLITLMTSNTLAGEADANQLMRLVREHDVDVLALQELTPDLVLTLRQSGLERELPYGIDESRWAVAGAGLWSRSPLRKGARTDPRFWAAPEGVIGDLDLRVRSIHPSPPITPDAEARWQENLASMPSARSTDKQLRILAGDFNATLDHRAFRRLIERGYTDAAESVGKGLIRTWPNRGKTPLTIDHVLVDRRIRVERLDVYSIDDTDHRAMVVELRLP
ncbi:MAG: endonuclease/exonuclease/phosphatase family protein [Solirubrobacterales bacterium]